MKLQSPFKLLQQDSVTPTAHSDLALIDQFDAVGTRACSVCEDDEKEQTLHKVPTFTQNRSFGSSGRLFGSFHDSGIGSGEKIELLSDMADVLGDKGMQDKGMSPSAVVEGQTKMKATQGEFVRMLSLASFLNYEGVVLRISQSSCGIVSACFERGASITRMYSQITLAEIAAQLQVGVRWAARGITVPMHLSALGSSLKLLLQEMNDVPFDHLKLMGMLLSSCMKT
ncbi:hypothetical protein Tco_0389766 [Tanacetum coccineum]